MRALVWIVEETWPATVAAAAAGFLPADADVTLLHVRASDTEELARGARYALLGRPRRPTAEPLETLSEQGARKLLAEAQTALGRDAVLDARCGRIEYEVITAAETMDLLVFARDKDRTHPGPRSLGPAARYVVDRAPCAVLLVWPDAAPDEQPGH
jgi:nucleotide-binding universal stress UspA family protein